LSDSVKNEQGKLEITESDVDEIIANFKPNAREGLPIDMDHDGGEATGWMNKLERVGLFLEATVEWTKLGVEKVKSKQYKFFSPEFSPRYIDAETGEEKGWVLIGGALVNRPLFKELAPITASENLTGDSGDMVLYGQKSHMDKKLEAILEKDIKDLTDDEKKVIVANEGELSDEQKTKYEVILADEDTDDDADTDTDTDDADTDKDVDNSDDDDKDDDDTVTGSEKTVAIKASELENLKTDAAKGVEALAQLDMITADEKAQEFIVGSEGGKGRILLKGKDDLTTLMLSFSDKQTELFNKVMASVPDAKMFSEIGKDESNTGTATQNFDAAVRKVMASEKVSYKEAVLTAKQNEPALYKAYNDEINSTK